MHKNVQRNLKNHKNHTTLLLFYVDMRNKFQSNKRQWISFRPQRWDVPYRKPSCLLWEGPVCEKYIPNLPQMAQNLYHGMLMPLHDSMPCFMYFRWVSDLLEFKNQASQWFAGNQRCPGVLKFINISSMGPKHAPKDTTVIFQPIYTHRSMDM